MSDTNLSFRELPPKPLGDALAESSERLVGSQVGPGCSALEFLFVLKPKLVIPNLGGHKCLRNLLVQTPIQIRVNLLHACEEFVERIATSPRNPMNTSPQLRHIRQVVSPKIVHDCWDQAASRCFECILAG